MRFISADVQCYGRIVDSKINSDATVNPIPGPNKVAKATY